MEKPPKLKVDTELVVNDGPANPPAVVEDETTAPETSPKAPGESSTHEPGKTSTNEPGAQVPAEKTLQSPRDQVAERAAKKLADQEFLAAYKKRERFVRVRFVVAAFFIVGGFFYTFDKIFDNNHAAQNAQFHFSSVILPALLGERDAAYFRSSAFPLDSENANRQGILDIRQKIMDSSIADLEKTGRTAIFSRLGAEQMLLSQGERARGLQYGDYLINKYPDLPSNYAWRARVDFDRGDFAHAIPEYEQFVALLKGAPQSVQKAWKNEIPKAVWACIDSGRASDARHFLALYKEYGAWDQPVQALDTQILLGQYDQLDRETLKETDLWSPALATYSEQLLSAAGQHADKLGDYYEDKDEITIAIALRSGKFDQAIETIDSMKPFNFMRYAYAVSTTKLMLYQNKPQAALAAVSKMAEKQPAAELDLLQATALQRLHAPERAVDVADRGLQWYHQPGTVTGRFYLPLLTIKARALNDLGKQQEALTLCEEVITGNPHMMGARLLKLQILHELDKQGQNKQAEVIKEREAITTLIKTLTAGE